MKALECSQHFSHYDYGHFFKRSRAANSGDPSPILLNFKPLQDFIAVLVTSKYEEDPIKNGGARMLLTSYIEFRRSRAANSIVGDRIWQKFKLIQASMVVLVTCKNDEDPSEN